MKPHRVPIACLLLIAVVSAFAAPRSGFYLPDSINEMSLKFKTIKNLIILPVIINDSIRVNLILDTGCRNLVLFGKRFQKLFRLNPNKLVQFSGLGEGNPVHGYLSLNNKVTIQAVMGENIPIVVVPEKNIFSNYSDVHGVVGYEIFLMFEIELNPATQIITFRPAAKATPPQGYSTVPLRLVDSRPVMSSRILFNNESDQRYDLMIDTGSSVGLLLKTTETKKFKSKGSEVVIGQGFNGIISGYEVIAQTLLLDGFEINKIVTGIILSPWHNHASIGMRVLKEYIVVLNYCKSYACFKKLA